MFSSRGPCCDAPTRQANIAAESRAKIVYEYLLQFTDDPLVKDSLRFLMTREIAHFQVFSAALETIQPNFPPGVLQGDPRYTHTYFNMSDGESSRGPWNEGQGPWEEGERWEYIESPHEHALETKGEINTPIKGSKKTKQQVQRKEKELGKIRSQEVKQAVPNGKNQWSEYTETT